MSFADGEYEMKTTGMTEQVVASMRALALMEQEHPEYGVIVDNITFVLGILASHGGLELPAEFRQLVNDTEMAKMNGLHI